MVAAVRPVLTRFRVAGRLVLKRALLHEEPLPMCSEAVRPSRDWDPHSPAWTLKRFVRQYHRVRSAAVAVASSEGVSFALEWDQAGTRVKTDEPPELKDLLILTRPFLDRSSELYLPAIVRLVRTEFPGATSEEEVRYLLAAAEKANRGDIGLAVDGVRLSAEECYRLVAEGEYFGDCEASGGKLTALGEYPLMGTLVRHGFKTHCIESYRVIERLRRIVKRAAGHPAYREQFEAGVRSRPLCIYCKRRDQPFASEEHVIPESLGNDEIVLPRGYVCDTCNNGMLASLDGALLSAPPVAAMRVFAVPYGKSGKQPKARLQNAVFERVEPRHLRIEAQTAKDPMRVTKDADGTLRFELNLQGRFDARGFARALTKVGLGYVAFEYGAEVALLPRFDAAREFVMADRDPPSDLLCARSGVPSGELTAFARVDSPKGSCVVLDIYGVVVAVGLEPDPAITLHPKLAEWFEFVPVRELAA